MIWMRLIIVTIGMALCGVPAATAEGLGAPAGMVVLTLTGKIAKTNSEGAAEFDLAMLEALPSATATVTAPHWPETEGGPHRFDGTLMRDLLETVGAKGDTLRALALDGYEIDLPVSDVTRYPVLLAWKLDGRHLKLGGKGPLWIVYPVNQFPELARDETNRDKWVYALVHLEVR